jgi:hypothetical protein
MPLDCKVSKILTKVGLGIRVCWCKVSREQKAWRFIAASTSSARVTDRMGEKEAITHYTRARLLLECLKQTSQRIADVCALSHTKHHFQEN